VTGRFAAFIAELRRRHVVRVALVYAAVGWAITEVSSTLFPALGVPAWSVSLVAALVVLGFPLALVLAWAFDLTPDGVRRTPALAAAAVAAAPATPAAAAAAPSAGSLPAEGAAILALPFVDRSPGGDHQYLGDGIAEELINSLARVGGLRVVSRTSAFALRDAGADLDAVRARMQVSHVVEGSVWVVEDRLRLTVQLVGVDDGYAVWSGTFNRRLDDLFCVQEQVARSVVETLSPLLFGPGHDPHATDPATLLPRSTRDFDAYALYLRARQRWNERTPESLERALEHFTEAVARDPSFAQAHAGMADCWGILVDHGIIAPAAGLHAARAAADHALRLAPDLAEAHTSHALICQLELRVGEAESAFRRALSLNPAYEVARHRLALLFAWRGRFDEARVEIRRAQHADPLSPVIAASLGWIEYFAGRHDEAVRIETAVLEEDPRAAPAHVPLALALVAAGRPGEAADRLRQAPGQERPGLRALLARALGRAGRVDEAVGMIAGLETADGAYVPPYALAQAWLGAGNTDCALNALEAALAARAPQLVYLATDPAFETLRDDARFRRILERIAPAD
jgi:adenylate cyclase